MTNSAEAAIRRNVEAHDRVASVYDRRHGEIFNPVEQARLAAALTRAAEFIQTARTPRRALDFGCGTGNLTRHFLSLGFTVVAADVSPRFLDGIRAEFGSTGRVETLPLNGRDLREAPDGVFDLVGAYSVLHHIPDYLAAVDELARVVAPGGVLHLDHEAGPGRWRPTAAYEEFRRAARRHRRKTWRERLEKLLRRFRPPRGAEEGDIHVHPDDHIEWDRIEARLAAAGLAVERREDYLLCPAHCPPELHAAYRDRCADYHALTARKPFPAESSAGCR